MGEALSLQRRNGVDEHAPGALVQGFLEVLKGPVGAGAQGDIGRGTKAGVALAEVGQALVQGRHGAVKDRLGRAGEYLIERRGGKHQRFLEPQQIINVPALVPIPRPEGLKALIAHGHEGLVSAPGQGRIGFPCLPGLLGGCEPPVGVVVALEIGREGLPYRRRGKAR